MDMLGGIGVSSPLGTKGKEKVDKVTAQRGNFKGYLYKKRRNQHFHTKAWSRRWFIVQRDTLKWFKSKKSFQACGYLNFHEVLSIEMVLPSDNLSEGSPDTCKDDPAAGFDFEHNSDEFGTYSFVVRARSRNLYLRAETYTQAQRWIKALTKQLKMWTGRTGKPIPPKMRKSGSTHDALIKRIDEGLEKIELLQQNALASNTNQHHKQTRNTRYDEFYGNDVESQFSSDELIEDESPLRNLRRNSNKKPEFEPKKYSRRQNLKENCFKRVDGGQQQSSNFKTTSNNREHIPTSELIQEAYPGMKRSGFRKDEAMNDGTAKHRHEHIPTEELFEEVYPRKQYPNEQRKRNLKNNSQEHGELHQGYDDRSNRKNPPNDGILRKKHNAAKSSEPSRMSNVRGGNASNASDRGKSDDISKSRLSSRRTSRKTNDTKQRQRNGRGMNDPSYTMVQNGFHDMEYENNGMMEVSSSQLPNNYHPDDSNNIMPHAKVTQQRRRSSIDTRMGSDDRITPRKNEHIQVSRSARNRENARKQQIDDFEQKFDEDLGAKPSGQKTAYNQNNTRPPTRRNAKEDPMCWISNSKSTSRRMNSGNSNRPPTRKSKTRPKQDEDIPEKAFISNGKPRAIDKTAKRTTQSMQSGWEIEEFE